MLIVTLIDGIIEISLYSKSNTNVTFHTDWSLVAAVTPIFTCPIDVMTWLRLQTVSARHGTIFSIQITVTGYDRTLQIKKK